MTLYMLAVTLFIVPSHGEVTKYSMTEDFCGRDVPFEEAVPLPDIGVTDTTVIRIPAMSGEMNCWVIVNGNGGRSGGAIVTTHPVNATCPHVMYKTRVSTGRYFHSICDVTQPNLVTRDIFPLVVDYTQTSQREPFDIIMVPVVYASLECQEKHGFDNTTCCLRIDTRPQSKPTIGQDDRICDRIVCINAAYICDGYVSCEDGRDEGELCDELKAQREAEERARVAAEAYVPAGHVLVFILCGIVWMYKCVNI